MAATLTPKVEPYDGSYSCLICSESFRDAGHAAVLHCTECSANPFHRDCAGVAWADKCPQCMRAGTVAPWCRASAGPSLEHIEPTRLDGDSDVDPPEDVNRGALTAATSSGTVDAVCDDDDLAELDDAPMQFSSEGAVAERTQTFNCSFCPKRFTRKSSVAKHERTHTGDKPYACSICPKRFAAKSNVARHERTHT